MIPSAVLLDLMVQPSLERLGHSALPHAPILETRNRPRRLARATAAARRRLTLARVSEHQPSTAITAPSAPQI